MVGEWPGARLKELRIAAGQTQKQLAERAGVSLRTIGALERGAYDPVWTTVTRLARALGVSIAAFLEPPARGAGRVRMGRPRKRTLPVAGGDPARPR